MITKEELIKYYNKNAFLSSMIKGLILNSDLIIFVNVFPFQFRQKNFQQRLYKSTLMQINLIYKKKVFMVIAFTIYKHK